MQKARSKGGDNTVSAQPSDRAVSLEGSTSNVHMPNCPSSPTLPSPWGGSQRWKEDKNRREGDQILAKQLNVCLPVHSPRRGHGYGAVDGVGKRGRTPWGVRRWPKLADTFYEEKLGITTTQRGIWWGRGAGVAPGVVLPSLQAKSDTLDSPPRTPRAHTPIQVGVTCREIPCLEIVSNFLRHTSRIQTQLWRRYSRHRKRPSN